MNPNTSNTKELLEQLSSGDSEQVANAAIFLEANMNIQLLADVIKILNETHSARCKTIITNLLSNTKNKDAIPIFINAIKDNKFKSIRSHLVSVCWQCELDFSEYISLFIDLFITEDLTVAIEACTVIENINDKMPENILADEIIRLQNKTPQMDIHKQNLVQDLISSIHF